MTSSSRAKRIVMRPYLFGLIRLVLGVSAIAAAATGVTLDLPLRGLLALSGAVVLAPLGGSIQAWRRRLTLPPVETLTPHQRSVAQASDGRGWSYGEVRSRALIELRAATRGVLALTSIMIIAQVLVGFLWLAASPFTILAIEATLWTGIVFGLHLGWRARRVLRAERWANWGTV